MWPGVRDLTAIGNFKKDEVISIKNSAGMIIADGDLGCSYE